MTDVSIIIPCYNVERYISECLDSVLKQTFKDMEIICVEDCSADKTKDILTTYAKKHKNIKIICNKTNQGLAISRNIGVGQSNGKYVYFLDSDDSISSDCIEKLYDKIKHDKCDLVMGGISVYPEDKHDKNIVTKSEYLQKWVNFKKFTDLKITEQNACDYYTQLHCCAVNKLYKKSFLTDNGICFINKNCFHEDNGFWLKILASNPVISGIESKTYFYRIRPKSITGTTDIDKKLKMSHVHEVLHDALLFIKGKNSKKLEKFVYYDMYLLKKHRFLYFVWTPFEKRLKLFSCPIFGLQLNGNKYRLKILGIPVLKWSKK